MEFTLNIKADPALLNALTALFSLAGAAAPAQVTAAVQAAPQQATQVETVDTTAPLVTPAENAPTSAPATEPAAAETGRISMETVRKAVVEFLEVDASKRPIVAELLSEYGAASVGKLDKEHFADFINKLKQA